jgi:hypothetical protein
MSGFGDEPAAETAARERQQSPTSWHLQAMNEGPESGASFGLVNVRDQGGECHSVEYQIAAVLR